MGHSWNAPKPVLTLSNGLGANKTDTVPLGDLENKSALGRNFLVVIQFPTSKAQLMLLFQIRMSGQLEGEYVQ